MSKSLLTLLAMLSVIAVVSWLTFLSIVYELTAPDPVGLHAVPTENAERAFGSAWQLPTLRVEEAAKNSRNPAGDGDWWYRIAVKPDDIRGWKERCDKQYKHWTVVRKVGGVPERVKVSVGWDLLAQLRRDKNPCPTWWRPEDQLDADVIQYNWGDRRILYAFSESTGIVYLFREED